MHLSEKLCKLFTYFAEKMDNISDGDEHHHGGKITNYFLSITWLDDWLIQNLDKFTIPKSQVFWLLLRGILVSSKDLIYPEMFIIWSFLNLKSGTPLRSSVTDHTLNWNEYGRVAYLTRFYLDQQPTYVSFTSN